MASDSQSTETSGNIRYPVDKLFRLCANGIWGASGSGQIIREIGDAVTLAADMLDATPDIRASLVSLVRPVLVKHYSNFIAGVPGLEPSSPATGTLAAGCTPDGERWILEVDHNCQYTAYEDRGFHAIGSAAGFAQLANAMMAHFDVKSKPLQYGKLIAYRTMRAAIDTSAYHVGPPIQMWVATSTGVRQLDEKTDIAQIEADVGGWEEVERDALDKYLGGGHEPDGVEEPMPPEVDAGP